MHAQATTRHATSARAARRTLARAATLGLMGVVGGGLVVSLALGAPLVSILLAGLLLLCPLLLWVPARARRAPPDGWTRETMR